MLIHNPSFQFQIESGIEATALRVAELLETVSRSTWIILNTRLGLYTKSNALSILFIGETLGGSHWGGGAGILVWDLSATCGGILVVWGLVVMGSIGAGSSCFPINCCLRVLEFLSRSSWLLPNSVSFMLLTVAFGSKGLAQLFLF